MGHNDPTADSASHPRSGTDRAQQHLVKQAIGAASTVRGQGDGSGHSDLYVACESDSGARVGRLEGWLEGEAVAELDQDVRPMVVSTALDFLFNMYRPEANP